MLYHNADVRRCSYFELGLLWNRALESLFTFTLLVSRIKQDAWHKRIQLKKGFHFLSTRTINSVRLILGSQYSLCETKSNEPPRLLWGLKQVLGTNLIPLRTKFDTQTKRVPAWPVINQLWFPERHFSANGISLRLGEVQMKICKGWLQALLSSAPRGFAARSRVLARLASLAQIGELARRLSVFGTYTLTISTVIKIFFILEGHKTCVWMFMFSCWKKAIEKLSLSINMVGPTKVYHPTMLYYVDRI